MPNHIHGIIVIDKPNSADKNNEYNHIHTVETPNLGVSTTTNTTTIPHKTDAASKKWKSASLGVIINQYKRICTIHSRKTDPNFAWQPRFHDHIIRNNTSFQRISNYIKNNPANWIDNTFFLPFK